jgi:hypothetical protein
MTDLCNSSTAFGSTVAPDATSPAKGAAGRAIGRPTDFERGARAAYYAAHMQLIQRELFEDQYAHQRALIWFSIRDAAEDALQEAWICRQARTQAVAA